jgi:hypothetical protein
MPTLTGPNGMTTREKGMIAFVVIAVLVSAGFIYWVWRQDQPQIADVNVLPPGSAAKLQAMKGQKAGAGADSSGMSPGGAGQDIPLNNKKPGGGG